MTLAVHDLVLERGRARVLDGVSAALNPGEITAICGPNGAGKSSLLMALAGLIEPAAGHVTLADANLPDLHLRKRARRVGYLPQVGEVAWDLSVRNLVALGRLPHGDRGVQEIEGALEATHLTDLADRPVSTLSGGERARALLARVFAGGAEWVLADEPLAALDFYHQLEVLASLRVAAGLGRGVVLVLHDLALAMNHADRVIVLNKGRVHADGPPETALSVGNIIEVWGVAAHWLGEPRARALVTGGGN
jgi:iron complex transport system ATP-binding protein